MAFSYPQAFLEEEEEIQARVKEILATELPSIVAKNNSSKLFIAFNLRAALGKYTAGGDKQAAKVIEAYFLPLSLSQLVALSEELKTYKIPPKEEEKDRNVPGTYARVVEAKVGDTFALFDDKNLSHRYEKLAQVEYDGHDYTLLKLLNGKSAKGVWYRFDRGATRDLDEMVPVEGGLMKATLNKLAKL